MSLNKKIKADLAANRNNTKGRFIVVTFRMANYFALHPSRLVRISGFPVVKFYQFFVMWLMGIEIPVRTQIGAGLNIAHGVSVVLNEDTIMGENVLLRQFVTIGNKSLIGLHSPVIGNNVEIGANSVLIGNILIGDNVVIGAGSIVTKSIPANSVAYGNPAKVIEKVDHTLMAILSDK